MSFPAPPYTTSLPPRSQITSLPGVPESTSGPCVPSIVHRSGAPPPAGAEPASRNTNTKMSTRRTRRTYRPGVSPPLTAGEDPPVPLHDGVRAADAAARTAGRRDDHRARRLEPGAAGSARGRSTAIDLVLGLRHRVRRPLDRADSRRGVALLASRTRTAERRAAT